MAHLWVGNGDWVLIGDGKKALLLVNEGDGELLNLRRRSVHVQESPKTREQGTDKPGRAFSSFSSGRSAYSQTDWHEMDEAHFADETADALNKAALAKEFDRLIVVAPPKILGELRHVFSDETKERIVAEIHKDLTKHSIPDIEKLISTYEA